MEVLKLTWKLCHTLPLTTKIKRVVNIKESGHYELSPKLPTEPSQKGHGYRSQGLLGSMSVLLIPFYRNPYRVAVKKMTFVMCSSFSVYDFCYFGLAFQLALTTFPTGKIMSCPCKVDVSQTPIIVQERHNETRGEMQRQLK